MLKLKELRFESGKTQEEIAKILKISRQVYANYENHINEPSLDMLNSMAILFNCSVDYLLGRTDDFGNVVITAQAQTYSADVQELIDIYDSLDEMHRVQVLEYARYFAERTQNTKRKNF